MFENDAHIKTAEQVLKDAAKSILFANILGAFFLGTAVFIINKGFLASIIAGYAAGGLNLYLFFKIIKKAVGLKPADMGSYVTRRYFARFFLIAALFIILISKLGLNPIMLILGFSQIIFITTAAMFFILRRNIKYA